MTLICVGKDFEKVGHSQLKKNGFQIHEPIGKTRRTKQAIQITEDW
jgi:hypothetical protein